MVAQPALTDEIGVVFGRLFDLEQSIDDRISTYIFRPPSPNLEPGHASLWNWIGDSPSRLMDTARQRDDVVILIQLAVRHSDLRIDHELLLELADKVRRRIDPAINVPRPFGCARALRQSMRNVPFQFSGDVNAIGLEFPLVCSIDAAIA
jgi:hypothetical protein